MSTMEPQGTGEAKPAESPELKELRQIRIAVQVLMWFAIIGVIGSIIIGIVVGVQVSKVNSNLGGGSGGCTAQDVLAGLC